MTKSFTFYSLFVAASVFFGSTPASAGVYLYAEYLLGEEGSLDANNSPLDAVGARNLTTTISPAQVTVGGPPGAYAGSVAYLDTSDPTNSGYYDAGSSFSDLATDNVAIGVYAKAAAIAGNTGTIFGTGNLGLDISLAANGWAGSIFNVVWASEVGGVTGSFEADTWAHLALIRADGVTTFYIDGVAQAGATTVAPANSIPHISVSPGGGSYFKGGIDGVRVVTFDSGEPTSTVLDALMNVSEAPFEITSIAFDDLAESVTLTWSSQPGRVYAIDRTIDLITWGEVTNDVDSQGDSTTFDFPESAPQAYFKVRAQP